MNTIIKRFVPDGIWSAVRARKIVCQHKKIAALCDTFIEENHASGKDSKFSPKCDFGDKRVIWQYWAQGYDNVPEKVRECLDSVEKYSEGYALVRLCDGNLSEYIDLPDYVEGKRQYFSAAHFADLLRLLLLETYGGVWLDATVFLSGPLPEDYFGMEYFMFQRDPDENFKSYWNNTYAYYFGWRTGFRVNVLNSIIFANKENDVITTLSSLMLEWWHTHDSLPDYFFFQILYDVLINGKMKDQKCPVVSDCLPHYLQQCINDPKFDLMSKEDILRNIPIHKLSYK